MPTIRDFDVVINKKYTMAVTGHRIIKDNISKDILKVIFKNAILDGFDTFLVGMAVGFDTLCFNVLEEIRKENNIRIIACIPCKNQDINFSILQKKEYKRMVNSADERIVLSEKYTPYCMLERNKFMVDNCSLLLAYLREKKGGTYYTVNYAEKNGVFIKKI